MKNRVEKERSFWNSYAQKYDAFIHNNASKTYETLLTHLAKDTHQAKNLLEIATGTGIIALKMSAHVTNIIAIDIAPEMISVAKEKCVQQSIGNVDFRLGDSCHLEFDNNSFDTIIASNVLHLLYSPDLAIQEMKRVLKDDGQIIIPTYCHGANLRSHVISRLMGLFGFKARTRWTLKAFENFVTSNGLKTVKTEVIHDKIPLVYLIAQKG
ncbi:methyltransferase family protein [Breznakibacter xylanolyticus]|uniref:Methyltransferase family protein n=1 Tax=Breznakibacter xylanolyticus TaxID=990 RepID=A0A2W7NFA3_9BACT|nr:class I SAM-dependent methyltransferase [Breznakibacter xylanolyticus]PZX18163.1 methyltransferase family protein [Breznakibacter xylanolyticus]